MDKYDRAVKLTDAGHTNAHIIATLIDEYDEGIATSTLADIRASRASRGRDAAEELRLAKRVLCRKMLLNGHTGYSVQKECKDQFETGLAYDVIQAVQAELDVEQVAENGPGLIEQVHLPSDIYEDPEDLLKSAESADLVASSDSVDSVDSEKAIVVHDPQVSLVVNPPPGPDGTLTSMKVIQQWMVSINAESLSLTRDGNLSVLARHDFHIGGAE